MALRDHYQQRYGAWAGNPSGKAPDLTRCCVSVAWNYRFRQCSKPNGHGPDGAFCKQHDPAAAAERRAKHEAKHAARTIEWRFQSRGRAFAEALKQIADGHNDPRQVARDALGDLYDNVGE